MRSEASQPRLSAYCVLETIRGRLDPRVPIFPVHRRVNTTQLPVYVSRPRRISRYLISTGCPGALDAPQPNTLTHIPTGQDFLESTFPATKTVPSSEAIKSASGSNDKELDREAREGKLVETKLDVPNTIIKFILDQTIGAAVNTLMFSSFTHSIKQAMAHRALAADSSDVAFLTSGKAIDYSQVDWRLVLEQAKVEFYPIMKAGLSLWPMVSLFNFVVVKSVEVRNLVGSLAGVIWGVYMSLVAAG